MSNSGKAFLAGLCSVLVFLIILSLCLYMAANSWSKSSYYDHSGDFLILFLVSFIAIPIVQYALSRSLKSRGKEELGRAIVMSIGIEFILIVLIIAITSHLAKLR